APRATTLLNPDLLEIGVEAPARRDHRVTPRVAEGGTLTAAVTDLGHRGAADGSGLALERFGQFCHPHDGGSGVPSLIALVAAGSGLGLLARIAGDHPEGAGNAGVELDPLDAARGLGADVVVVIGLAADHDAEAGDAAEPPGLGAPSGGERQLEGARNLV